MQFEQYQAEVLDTVKSPPPEYRLSAPWIRNQKPTAGVWSLGEAAAEPIVKIPSGVTDENGNYLPIDRLRAGLFADCAHITDVAIPSGVRLVGPGLFQNCRNLRRIVLPKKPFFPNGSFAGCEHLEEIYYEGEWDDFTRKVLRLYKAFPEGGFESSPDGAGEFSLWNPELLGVTVYFNCKMHD